MADSRINAVSVDLRTEMRKLYPWVFVLAFWAVLIAPISKGSLTVTSLQNDFRGHDRLIQLFNTVRSKIGDRIFPNAIIGDVGWLYYTGDRSMDDYQGTNPYTDAELAGYQKSFDALYDYLQQKGIAMLVVIAPDKNTIYPQYLPASIEKTPAKTRLDQFQDFMNEHGKTPVIDLRPDLLAASQTADVYYQTDTHWNPFGGYVAYKTVFSSLSQQIPTLVAHPLSDYEESHWPPVTFGIPIMMGMPNIQEDYLTLDPRFKTGTEVVEIPLLDGNKVRISRNQNQQLPSALIFHDSFFDVVIPFMEPHFRQTTSIFRTGLPGLWNINWVDQVHPDVVIIEYVERYLNYGFLIPEAQQ
jgi:alginate O-acetyltransferase complex protein AlgJ